MWISKKEYDELKLCAHELGELHQRYVVVHEVLVRLVEQKGALTFDLVDEIPDGYVKWDSVMTEAGSREMAIWFVPGEPEEVTSDQAQATA